MSASANVQSIQALDDLRAALARFQGPAQEALTAAEQEIRRTLDWLQERHNHWLNEVRRRQEVVRRAQAALSRCMASGDRDHPPSCGAQERALRDAQARLREAQAELANVQHWRNQVQRAVTDYSLQARRLDRLTTAQTAQAQALLKAKTEDLERYFAIALAGSVLGMPFFNALKAEYGSARIAVGSYAVKHAKLQEIDLVHCTGRGTRAWTPRELSCLKRGSFPKGYVGHHINNVARFPDLAADPDNIIFVNRKEHLGLHRGSWRNATSGRRFNRKSLIVQWARFK